MFAAILKTIHLAPWWEELNFLSVDIAKLLESSLLVRVPVYPLISAHPFLCPLGLTKQV